MFKPIFKCLLLLCFVAPLSAAEYILEDQLKDCKDGRSGACWFVGYTYYKGEGVKQDYQKAYDYFKQACDGKNAKGCFNLGVFYESGKGVRQNQSTAKRWFGKACDMGYQGGCDAYRKLNEAGVQ